MECEATGWRCSANPLRHLPTTRRPQAVSSLAAQVDHACRETGFLYVSGHALSQADIDRQLALVQRLRGCKVMVAYRCGCMLSC